MKHMKLGKYNSTKEELSICLHYIASKTLFSNP